MERNRRPNEEKKEEQSSKVPEVNPGHSKGNCLWGPIFHGINVTSEILR